MKKIKILFLLLLAGGGLSHASVQKTLFSADVVASACHVVVDADGTGSSRLTFGTYRKSSAAPVPPRDFTVRLYETGATVQGCSAFLAGQIATLNFGNPGQLDGQGVVTRGAGDGIRIDVRAADTQADIGSLLDANGKKVAVDNDTAQKLLMFMPGDEVQVKGNVVKVDSLNDYGELQTWTINQKKTATSPRQKTSDTAVNSSDKAGKK